MRVGTQIERDFEEAKRYWSQNNAEMQKCRNQTDRDTHPKANTSHTRILQSASNTNLSNLKILTLPMLIRGRYFRAMIDTGSSLTLLQESCWKQLRHKEQLSSSRGQTFKQTNGQVLSALGMWNCECEVQGRRYDLPLYVMKDEDLTVHPWNGFSDVYGN